MLKINKKLSTLLFVPLLTILLVSPVFAGDEVGPQVTFEDPLKCGEGGLEACLADFLQLALAIAIPIATIYFLWAGVKMIKAGSEGDSSKLAEAKKALLWSIIGLFVLGSLTGITAILKSLLNV